MSAPERRRIDLRRLPYGLGYLLALIVVGLVLGLAWTASRGTDAPGWWERLAVPTIRFVSPFVVLLLVWGWIRRRRRRAAGSGDEPEGGA